MKESRKKKFQMNNIINNTSMGEQRAYLNIEYIFVKLLFRKIIFEMSVRNDKTHFY